MYLLAAQQESCPLSEDILACLSVPGLWSPAAQVKAFHECVAWVVVVNAGAAALQIPGPHLRAFGFSGYLWMQL